MKSSSALKSVQTSRSVLFFSYEVLLVDHPFGSLVLLFTHLDHEVHGLRFGNPRLRDELGPLGDVDQLAIVFPIQHSQNIVRGLCQIVSNLNSTDNICSLNLHEATLVIFYCPGNLATLAPMPSLVLNASEMLPSQPP